MLFPHIIEMSEKKTNAMIFMNICGRRVFGAYRSNVSIITEHRIKIFLCSMRFILCTPYLFVNA